MNSVPSWLFWLFPMVFPGLFHLYWVTGLSTTNPVVISSVLWLTSATQDLFFLSFLESLGYCFHSSLRFFVTFFLSGFFVSDHGKSVLIDFLFLATTDWVMLYPILISCWTVGPIFFNGHFSGLFHIRLFFLTKLLFSVVMLWGCGLNSTSSQVIGLSVVVTLCS